MCSIKWVLSALCVSFSIHFASSLNKTTDCECRIWSNQRIQAGYESSEGATIPWLVNLMIMSKDVDRLIEQKNQRWAYALNAPLDPYEPYSESIEQRKHYTGIELHFLQKRIDKLKVEQHFCHGIVINEWTVMTAASCLMAGKEPIGIGKGQTRLEAYDGGLTRVLEQIVHIGAYHKQNVPNGYTQSDLAIVKLYSPLSFTPDSPVRPACLNLKASHIHHGSLSAAGLGRAFPQTIYKGMIIPQKIEDLMHTIKRMQFKDISQQRKSCVDHEELMCLESINSSVAICDGDFGTPLHHTMQGLSHVIGLASFSETEDSMGGYSSTCNRRSVFTRLSWNEAWIRKQLGDNFCEVR